MKYLCLAYFDAPKLQALTEQELDALVAQCAVHDERLRATGKVLMQSSLGMPDEAASIRPRGGKPIMTDGPFTESNEQIGGMFLVEARTLSEALEVAAKHPAAMLGETVGWGIEVRPLELFEEYAVDQER